MTILSHIQQLLEEKGLACALMVATPVIPYDRLLLFWGDERHTEDFLEITTQAQQIESPVATGRVEGAYYLLQFQYILPFKVSVSTFSQVSSSLHFFNRLLHCPGFELDELSDQILYRYAWFIKDSGIDSFLLMQVLGSLQLCVRMFSPYIKDIAEGRYTLEEVLEKVVQLTKQPPSKF